MSAHPLTTLHPHVLAAFCGEPHTSKMQVRTLLALSDLIKYFESLTPGEKVIETDSERFEGFSVAHGNVRPDTITGYLKTLSSAGILERERGVTKISGPLMIPNICYSLRKKTV